MATIEQNTKLFYEELNNNSNIDILLRLAKKGIFLYEPLFYNNKIKNSDYLIDISILSRQYFMINSKTQYERFFYIIEHYDEYNIFSLYMTKYNFVSLLIINEYFIKQLMNDNNENHIEVVLNYYSNTHILKILLKYNIISYNAYCLFGQRNLLFDDIRFEIYEYFYFNNVNYLLHKNSRSFNFDKLFFVLTFIIKYAYDINMLKYCVELIERFNIKLPSYLSHIYKIPLNFPINDLKLYSNKIYMPNYLILKHKNDNFENFINIIISDDILVDYIDTPDLIYQFQMFNELKRYGIDIDTIKKSDISIENAKNRDIQTTYYVNHFKLKKVEYKNRKSKKEKLISKCVLNDYNKVQNLLNDCNYIFTLDINFKKEIFLINISYIISLIHNKYNNFIIKYLTSFLYLDKNYTIVFENNEITFYYEGSTFSNNYFIKVLLNVPNKTFRTYINFKSIDLLSNNESIIRKIPFL